MSSRELITLALYYCGGSIKGKTLLQKRLYFLTELAKKRYSEKIPNLKFIPYYYGPYSPIANEDLIILSNSGIISEIPIPLNYSDIEGYPAQRWDYSLTEKGREWVKEISSKYSEISSELNSICSKMVKLDENNYLLLSWAAKTHFLVKKKGKPVTIKEIKEEASKTVKWVLDEKQIDAAVTLLKDLNLVVVEKG